MRPGILSHSASPHGRFVSYKISGFQGWYPRTFEFLRTVPRLSVFASSRTTAGIVVFFSPFTAKHVIDKKSTSSQALCRGMKSLHSREKVRRHGVPQPMLSCAGRVVRNLKHGNYCAATVYDACSLAKLSSTDAFFVTSLQNLLNFHPNPQDFISTKIQSPGW